MSNLLYTKVVTENSLPPITSNGDPRLAPENLFLKYNWTPAKGFRNNTFASVIPPTDYSQLT